MITTIIVLLLLLAVMAKGYQQGFIKEFGSFISAIISLSLFLYIFQWWQTDSIIKIALVIVIFIVFWLLFKLSYWLLSKILKLFYVIPFMKSVDKIFGGILGLFEGVLLVTVVNFIIVNTTWLNFIPWHANALLNLILRIGHSMIIGI